MEMKVKIDGVKCIRNAENIEYAEVKGNALELCFEDGKTAKIYSSLKQFILKYGSPNGLIKAHRQFALNLSCVKRIIKYCMVEMNCGMPLETGREAYNAAKKFIADNLNNT